MTFNDGRNEEHGMDETGLRAIIREEIALAMRTLGEAASNAGNAMSDDHGGERDGMFAIDSAAGTFFESVYKANCAVADEQRAEDAANPFKETGPSAAVDPATATFVRGEVTRVLEALGATARYRDMPYETGEIEGTALRAIADSADGAVQEYEARCETADAESKTAE